jgi:hypothetical protein
MESQLRRSSLGHSPVGYRPRGHGKYANYHGDGLYDCICCDTVLFDSKTKLETGWASFWQPAAKENVTVRKDLSLGCAMRSVATLISDTYLTMAGAHPPPLLYELGRIEIAARRKAS